MNNNIVKEIPKYVLFTLVGALIGSLFTYLLLGNNKTIIEICSSTCFDSKNHGSQLKKV